MNVTTHINKGIISMRNEKEVELPFMEDLIHLDQKIDQNVNELYEKFKTESRSETGLTRFTYVALTTACLVKLLSFNKRRSGELARMTINQFFEKRVQGFKKFNHRHVLAQLSKTEKALASTMTLVRIASKNTKAVPVLMDAKIETILRALIAARSRFVAEKNKYVFGIANSSSLSAYSGSKCLNRWVMYISKTAPFRNASLITAGRMRKAFSSAVQLMNVGKETNKLLYAYLGHTKAVHDQHYIIETPEMIMGTVGLLLSTFNQRYIDVLKKRIDSGEIGK